MGAYRNLEDRAERAPTEKLRKILLTRAERHRELFKAGQDREYAAAARAEARAARIAARDARASASASVRARHAPAPRRAPRARSPTPNMTLDEMLQMSFPRR